MSWKRWLPLALKFLVSAGLIAYLLERIGIGEAAQRARGISSTTLAIVLALCVSYVGVSTVRWLVVLRALGERPAPMEAARIMFVSAFFNQFLPTSVGGDVMRIWEAYRRGLGLAATVDSVLVERAAYIASVSLVAASGATAWDDGSLPAGAVLGLWTVFAAALVLCALLAFVDRVPARLLPAALAGGASRLAADARLLYAKPAAVATVVVTALLNQALVILAVLAVAQSLDVPLQPIACVALMPAVILVASLPISIAGWGVREYAMVTGFGYAGVPASAALVFSLVVALGHMTASLPGGLFWLARSRRNLD
jgi:uncharacterized membrane protein YbhN (UPF0104 family)